MMTVVVSRDMTYRRLQVTPFILTEGSKIFRKIILTNFILTEHNVDNSHFCLSKP
jgi:hypothetical protein